MEEDRITILLTGPAASRKKVFRGLARKKLSGRKASFLAAAGTYTYMEQSYLLLELPALCSPSITPPTIGPSAILQDRQPSPSPFFPTVCVNAVVVVCDALFLEQGLDQLTQLIHIDAIKENALPLLLCICDCEGAQAQGIWIDHELLEDVLQIPVLPLDSRTPTDMDDLKAAIAYAWKRRFSYDLLDFSSKKLAEETTHYTKKAYGPLEDKMDHLLTRPVAASCILVLFFFLLSLPVLAGVSLLSGPLKDTLAWLCIQLSTGLAFWGDVFHIPSRLMSILSCGILQPLVCVLFVMLPPLAVYLPLYFVLEDAGLLPRAAFAADKVFARCGGCGRQCLSMSMGLCCHQAGIVGCRAIRPACSLPSAQSVHPSQWIRPSLRTAPLPAPADHAATKEEMAALLTISLLPCCGRMPALLFFLFFFSPGPGSFLPALILAGLMILGTTTVLGSSFLLSHTALHRFPSAFFLELPSIRRPRLWKKVLPAALDHTCLFLGKGAFMAIFAGLLIWGMANTFIQGTSLLTYWTAALDPFGRLLGLDGVILTAFILGAPADEIALPVMLLLYQTQGALLSIPPLSIASLSDLHALLLANGWTWQTALSAILFTLFHWPCASTLAAIRQETGQLRWALAALFLPTLWGMALCAGLTFLTRTGV